MRRCLVAAAMLLVADATIVARGQAGDVSGFLRWTTQQALDVGRAMRVEGRVGGALDLRVIRTERSYNYKLRATWLTPDVMRATARLAQLSQRLSDEETVALVREGEAAGDMVVLMEIDPREGSGVVPLDIVVLLQPKGAAVDDARTVRGTVMPALREKRALAGVFRRDYAYEQLWVVFPLDATRRSSLMSRSVDEVELVVRIYDKEGRVAWRIPQALRQATLDRPGE